MSTYLSWSLLCFDIVLFFLFYFQRNKKDLDETILDDLAEERKMIESLIVQTKSYLEEKTKFFEKNLKESKKIAAEIEIESSNAKQNYANQIESIKSEIEKILNINLLKLKEEISFLEKNRKRSEKERLFLSKSLEKAEKILSFFDKNLNLQELINEIKYKKYSDVREMTAKGFTDKEILFQTGLASQELEIIKSMGSTSMENKYFF